MNPSARTDYLPFTRPSIDDETIAEMQVGRMGIAHNLTPEETSLLSAVLLFVAGYQGYGALAIAVGAAAAINLA